MSINTGFLAALERNCAALHAAVGQHLTLPAGTLPFGVSVAAGFLVYLGVGRYLGASPPVPAIARGYAVPVVLAVALRLFYANPPSPSEATYETVRFVTAIVAETLMSLHLAAMGLACLAVVSTPRPFQPPR